MDAKTSSELRDALTELASIMASMSNDIRLLISYSSSIAEWFEESAESFERQQEAMRFQNRILETLLLALGDPGVIRQEAGRLRQSLVSVREKEEIRASLKKRQIAHNRMLNRLKEAAAQHLHTPPELIIKIETIEEKIQQIQEELHE